MKFNIEYISTILKYTTWIFVLGSALASAALIRNKFVNFKIKKGLRLANMDKNDLTDPSIKPLNYNAKNRDHFYDTYSSREVDKLHDYSKSFQSGKRRNSDIYEAISYANSILFSAQREIEFISKMEKSQQKNIAQARVKRKLEDVYYLMLSLSSPKHENNVKVRNEIEHLIETTRFLFSKVKENEKFGPG